MPISMLGRSEILKFLLCFGLSFDEISKKIATYDEIIFFFSFFLGSGNSYRGKSSISI